MFFKNISKSKKKKTCSLKHEFPIHILEVNSFLNEQPPSKHSLVQSSYRKTRKKREICSKLTVKTPERRSGVFIVNTSLPVHFRKL